MLSLYYMLSPYKKCFAQRVKGRNYKIHLWTDDGYKELRWTNKSYIECSDSEATHIGLNGEPLKVVTNWEDSDSRLHFHDMTPHQKFLIERYGVDDRVSVTHKEVFFDIETEMGDSLTVEYIKSAPKKVTSIAYWDKQADQWGMFILDEEKTLNYIKNGNKEIIPCLDEEELLYKFIEKLQEIEPDILIGFNSDYFDIPYLYHRIIKVLGMNFIPYLSPIGIVRETPWFGQNQFIQIAGVENLDYMRLHKKYSQYDEPSYALDYLGKKYVNLGKIEYNGSLDRLFREDINKFIEYNFRDVEILKALDEYFNYIQLTKGLSHKGKHNYSEVYASTKTHDGTISSYLLSQKIIPPAKERNAIIKTNYAGGFTFCPNVGLFNYIFDEDLTSQYPNIIRSLNIGRETLVARIIDPNDRNNRLGLNDLKRKDPEEILLIENTKRSKTQLKVKELLNFIIENKWTISANGVMFRTDKRSVLSVAIDQYFDERMLYQGKMNEAYKKGNKKEGDKYNFLQYRGKILLNSLYGGLALGGAFRYANVILAEAITLTGQRVIQESALTINEHINKVIKGEISLDL